jgi:hypothetical protein
LVSSSYVIFPITSLSHWKLNGKSFADRLTNANITGLPYGQGSNEVEMSTFFCNHVNNIRKFAARHPSHALIELDIESPLVGEQLESLFGITSSCWGASNKNPALHGGKNEEYPYICLH